MHVTGTPYGCLMMASESTEKHTFNALHHKRKSMTSSGCANHLSNGEDNGRRRQCLQIQTQCIMTMNLEVVGSRVGHVQFVAIETLGDILMLHNMGENGPNAA